MFIEPKRNGASLNEGFIVVRPISEPVVFFSSSWLFGLLAGFWSLVILWGKKVYFWHSTGPLGGSFVGLAISKFAKPVLFSVNGLLYGSHATKPSIITMFSSKDYSKMTLDELVSEEKRMKSQKTLVALIIGLIVGIAIWSATHKWGAFFTFGLLILPLLIGSSYSKTLKSIETEISSRDTVG